MTSTKKNLLAMINKYFFEIKFLTQGEQLAPSTQLFALPALLLPGLQFLFLFTS